MAHGPFTVECLFERVLDVKVVPASVRRARALHLDGLSLEKVEKVWNAFVRHIAQQLALGKGVNAPSFGKFVLLPDARPGKKAAKAEPAFLLNEGFARTYKATQLLKPTVPLQSTVVDLNWVGLSFEAELAKEQVQSILQELLQQIGQAILCRKQPLMLEFFGIGTLYADHGKVDMVFGERNGRGRGRDESSVASFSRSPLESASELSLNGLTFGRDAFSIPEEEEGSSGALEDDRTSFPDSASQMMAEEPGEGDHRLRLSIPRLTIPVLGAASVSSRSTSNRIQYPVFLDRDPFNPLRSYQAAEDRVERRVQRTQANVDRAFHRMQEQVEAELVEMKKQDDDIQARHERSDMLYKQRLVDQKNERLETNAFLLRQAAERREQEQKDREARRQNGVVLPEGFEEEEEEDKVGNSGYKAVPFPVEQRPDHAGAMRTKDRLRKALTDQMRQKTLQSREKRVSSVAEERFLVDCNSKLLQADREEQRRKKQQTHETLREQWSRQKDLAQMQHLLTEAKNGKILRHVQSESGLLTVRSVASSARR